jgi:hypothetical protein
MLKKFCQPQIGIFLVLWLVLLVGGRTRFFRDPGTFWHTVVGEQMLSTGALIYHDTFSFTFAGQPWSPHQWLGECLMALVHRLGQLDALLLVTATILACLYTWLAGRFLRGGLHWSLAALATALALGVSSSHFHIRPHIGTIVLTGTTLAFLMDFEAGRIGLRRLFWLVPIYVLWSNIHGGMLGGLGTMAIVLAGWGIARAVSLESPLTNFRQLLSLGALAVACALTMFVNPYGVRLPQIWREIMDSPILPQIIQEHAPLNLTRPDGIMVVLFFGLYLAVLAGVPPRRVRVTWLVPVIWFYLACTRVRHAPLFAITAGLAMADAFPHSHWAARLVRAGSDLFQMPKAPDQAPVRWVGGWAVVPTTLVLIALFLQAARIEAPLVGRGWARLEPAYWPVDVLPFLQACQNQSGPPTPIFNEYLFGRFLIYQTPRVRVFVDDRCELYGGEWLRDYVLAEHQNTAEHLHHWEKAYTPFAYALTQTGSGYDRYFEASPDWTPVKQTAAASLYRRVAPDRRAMR